MKPFTVGLNKRKLAAVLLGSALCLGTSAWVTPVVPRAPTTLVAAQDRVDEVTLTITTDGFTPATLTRPAGRFMLSVDNRTDMATLILRLNNEDGSLLRELKVPANTLDWSEAVELAAGSYTLTEAQHPAWVCHITVQ
jgi:hypothetical protein